MIILLHGPDDYRRNAKREELVAEFLKKNTALGVGRFDLEEEGARDELESFLRNQSMFAPKRLAAIENSLGESDKTLAAIYKNHLEGETTLLLSEKTKPAKPWAFLLSSKPTKCSGVLVQEFEYLAGAEWSAFVAGETKARGAALTPAAQKFLAAAYAKDTWRLVTELDKLALIDKKTISQADLEEMEIELIPNFWATMNGLKSSRVGERLATLEAVLARNEPAAKIFNILAYQWPEKMPQFAAYDRAVKMGRCDYEETLVDLLIA